MKKEWPWHSLYIPNELEEMTYFCEIEKNKSIFAQNNQNFFWKILKSLFAWCGK